MFKIFISLLVMIQKPLNAFRPLTENNRVLVGHVFRHLYSADWFNCIQACHDEPRCISYNYQRSAGANGLCELNDSGVEDSCNRDKLLIYSGGFVFQQIRKTKVCCFDVTAVTYNLLYLLFDATGLLKFQHVSILILKR